MSPSDDDNDDDRTLIRPPSQRAAAAPLGHTLAPGTKLRDYEITGLIGEGGFGIVYLAWDHSLQRKVAIKEYMPASLVSRLAGSSAIVVKSERHLDTFRAGLKSFVNEARLLARFDHPALVKVYRYWEENGTAYMAMPFYEGPTLKASLAKMGQAPSETQLRAWLAPLLDALTVMHAAQCFHRDIAPDNILLTATGPLLLDFGAARRVIGDMTHALTVVLKPGYAPIEQYGDVASMSQGAWTDIYALACVVYYAITGRTPTSSVERLMDDRLEPIAVQARGRYGDGFLRAVDAALAVRPQDRPQNAAQFRALLDIDLPAPPPLPPQSGYGALSHAPFPPTQDGGYTTVPGTLAPELATHLQPRPAEPTVPPPRAQAAPPPRAQAAPPPTARATPPARPRVAPTEPPAPSSTSAQSRAIGLGLAFPLVVTGLVFGIYWALQSRADGAATPTAPSAPGTVVPAIASAPAVAAASAGIAPPASVAIEAPPAGATAIHPLVASASAAPASASPTPRIDPPRKAAVEPAAPAAISRQEPAAPSRPRRDPARAEPPTESRQSPGYSPASSPASPPAYPPPKGARCSDILQKASLEPLTAEEAVYLKRECR
ncbi:MAG: serine/threonine-protein kinase [Caldimonas sp.]